MYGNFSTRCHLVMRSTSLKSRPLFLAGLLLLSETCLAQSWGAVGAGYIYQASEGSKGGWTSSNGWYVLPTFNITKNIGVSADFANFYSKGQNIHVDLFGPVHAFGNRTRFTPFIFTGVGRIRDSKLGVVTNSFAWYAGGGFLIRLTRWVSFQTIPVEYVMNTSGWNVGNNWVARAGFAITIPK
jgi:hypothetical protein